MRSVIYKFDIVKHRKKIFILTLLIVAVSIISLFVRGLNLGVDFVSGTRLDIHVKPNVDLEKARTVLTGLGYHDPDVRTGGSENEFVFFRVSHSMERNQINQIEAAFEKAFQTDVNIQAQTVSPVVGRETAMNAIKAVLIASVFIMIYVAIRFEFRFAVSAVLALLYDVMFVVGTFSLFQIEVDLVFIAAVLTIVGYSINDTIVIFDRIRENMKQENPAKWDDLAAIVNNSIMQTLVRSINTVLTVVFAALLLWLLGGESIRNFSLALLLGLISGAYSSIFVASPLWVTWKWKSMQKKHPSKKAVTE
ncbi:protein translocase subunit SecF [Thermoactinomyces vulgaris]|uniref:protein translocase subunit SecF n=1 Tax=Thermoactinomyces vulgaris TaxID=2026 RepID=UPI0006A2401C